MMMMQNSELDPQDQRKTSGMEDSTAMTIEFLRARLLSERSVSRSARKRADELAKKVIELEEQLMEVTLQRKMAEKATADVLAILENIGISDVSEEFDLGSDQEMPCESGVDNDCTKEVWRSRRARGRRHGSDELSGSDVDSSPVAGNGRSLSWKGRVDTPRLLEKYKTSNLRRRSSFSSIISSPKHHLGKSCRQIRRREARSVVEESGGKPVNINCQENQVVLPSEGFSNSSDGGSNIQRKESKVQEEDELEVKLDNTNHDSDGYGKEKEMEKALEQQAQLIGQYEAMEKAQREWEEKFRENNSTPDSCDPGNHSDITEERDESKAQSPCSATVVTSDAQQTKVEGRDVGASEAISKPELKDGMPKSHNDAVGLRSQNSTAASNSGLLAQENVHPQLKGNQNKSSENCHYLPSDRCYQGLHRHDSPSFKLTNSSPTDVYGGPTQKDNPGIKNDLYTLVPHKEPHQFTVVLESLKQARLLLQQELNSLPLLGGGYVGKATQSSVSMSNRDRLEIPVGCSGLFRLPTEFSDESTARANFLDSASHFSPNLYLDRGISRISGDRLGTSPYYASRLSFSSDDQSLVSRYVESGSRFDTTKPSLDASFDVGLPSSGKYMYPTYPIYPSYQNSTPEMPFSDGFSRPYSSGAVGADHFSFYDNHVRPNMYR